MRNTINHYALPFAAWELRLYLDTHPADEKALAAYRQICLTRGCDYACHTPEGENGASCRLQARREEDGCDCGDNRWTWIDGPWPWEPAANDAAKEV